MKGGVIVALQSIKISATNNQYLGCVDFESTKQTSSLDNISYMIIFRRKHGFLGSYDRIVEKKINTVSDLDYSYLDITVRSGTSYDYYVELTNSIEASRNIIEFGSISNVKCEFDGMFVGDYDTQYMAQFNSSTSQTRNTQSNYVTTLSGRTPYVITNSNLNYTTGQSSGLFMQLDENNNPLVDETGDYMRQVVDYLSDGENKLLKTSSGDMWYVFIDPGIDVAFNDNYLGYNPISFNWTEIDDVPVLRKVA